MATLMLTPLTALAGGLAAAAPSPTSLKTPDHGMDWVLGGILIISGLLVIHGLRLSAEIREARTRRIDERRETA